MERLDGLRVPQASYDTEIARLRRDRAREDDRHALAQALAGGEPEPEPRAAAIEAQIEPKPPGKE
jgi:hypothetical protein